ncbi:MAG: nucleoside phosphorylase [Prevotellaceae bacterium]|jgi:uridine phosphorylase|nr:nucleoside phosphorylase [Prevotellaceae bacterium]
MNTIPSSELIINSDGSIFHLHIKPHELADTVILVGDPGRVKTVSNYFSTIESQAQNREFVSATGLYKGNRITVVSTGIGTDNIDIVVNELDALANIDFRTRTIKPAHRKLTILRLGTSGGLQPHLQLGDFVFSAISIGFDGLLNFYARRNEVCLLDYEAAFVAHTQWNKQHTAPYFVRASEKLTQLFSDVTVEGMTISAPGFYGPQGRVLRLPLANPQINERIESFRFDDRCITNFEMESSAIAGLAKLLGHEAGTICCIIANRIGLTALTDYKTAVQKMIEMALEKLTGGK